MVSIHIIPTSTLIIEHILYLYMTQMFPIVYPIYIQYSKGSVPPGDLECDYGDDLEFLIARLKLIEGEKDVSFNVVICIIMYTRMHLICQHVYK